jgi:hypothetical protein
LLSALHHFFAPMPGHGPLYFGKLAGAFVFVVAVLAALQAAPRRSRRGIIALFTFLGGLYYVAEFFWPAPHGTNPLTPYQDPVATISTVISAFAIGVGVISLLQLHTRAVARQRPGWGNSVVLIVMFVAMTVFGLLNDYAPHLRVLGSSVTSTDVFNFLFQGGLTNLGAATFAMIAFYIASAAYRAFRIRSMEATLLMAAALIVMLGAVFFGTVLTNWIPKAPDNPWSNFRIENIAQWLLMEVNGAAQRGILFGLTIGLLATSLRLWLSLERSAYFDQEL